jgi:hypothetical protein
MLLVKKAIRYWRQHVWALFAAGRYASLTRDVSAFCMFIGHGRSGSTLCGSLLTAHPEIVIGHEADALAFVQRGMTRDQLYAVLIRRDRRFADRGNRSQEYNYNVPDQWQGRFQQIRVIGDKESAATTRRLRQAPQLLSRLREQVRVPIRIVHPIRNPFDNITTIARRSGASLEQSAERYFTLTQANATLIDTVKDAEILTVRHEDLISEPKQQLKTLVEWLGLSADEAYLAACAGIVYKSPSRSRKKAPWTPDLIRSVQSRVEQYPFLRGYTFDT